MKSTCLRFAYFGHHKCASTWIQYLTGKLSGQLGLRHAVVPTPSAFSGDLQSYLARQPTDFLCYTNAEWSQVEPLLEGRRAFHVIRDPRDIVVSAYFSHLHSHTDSGWPELAKIRAQLAACSKRDGLIQTIDNLINLPVAGTHISLFDALLGWRYDHPGILEVRYEEMVADPHGSFLRILRFLDLVDETPFGLRAQAGWLTWHLRREAQRRLGLPAGIGAPSKLPSPLALQIVQDYSFERISGGRRKGEENVSNHFRKGVAGDWRNHFDDDVLAYFRRRTGPLLSRLGYEDRQDAEASAPPRHA